MKTYVTFGQKHVHSVNGKIFDKDCVAVVDGGRDKVFELFGPQFCFEYPEEEWHEEDMKYFNRGYIEVQLMRGNND